MERCIFCRILARQTPAKIVFEDDSVFAVEDINPQSPVHLLVIPREHLVSLKDAAADREGLLGHLLAVAAKLARERRIESDGYRLVINTGALGGQSVFHLHVHVMGGRMFHWPPG
ncbi:MAG: histidine triad nucleotide-binding protein [Acidobacteria bacterium]|nr:histidine triad nucleotide-binding protein [Acidobacteriota bacterium]